MKTIIVFATALCLSVSMAAQTVTVQFTGTNKNRNFQVVLDGTSYYSNSAAAANGKKITIPTLQPGDHTISVYRTNNSRYTSGVTGAPAAGAAVYSKIFQLRTGYDMNIAIKSTGQVSFTEKRNRNPISGGTATAMSETGFNNLLNSIRSKWSQTARIASIRSAFTSTTNYFTTDQVGQLLSLVTSEASRLDLAKIVYPRVTDATNFSQLSELFSNQTYRDQLDLFIKTNGGTTTASNNNPVTTTNYGNRTPITDSKFSDLLQTVNNQYQQAGKVAVVKDALDITTYYFTTAQLRQLITPVTAEHDRLTLLKQAYSRAADTNSFYTLSDLLYSQSSRAQLDTYIRTGGVVSSNNYSNRIAMSDAEFMRLEMKARLHFRQSSVVQDIRTAFNTTAYYSVLQIRQLLLLVSSEADRLSLAKLAFHRVTDPTGYKQLDDLFTLQASRDELARYTAANWF